LGWHLIHKVMDAVSHEAPPEGGNRLVLVKRLQSAH
jgi:anti-sigma regulatory factor (Ser/Thr protein kinase)